MKRFLRNIGISLATLLVAAWVADRVFTRVFRSGNATKAQWVNGMHRQHYDLAIIGSSRAWWNIDMNTIDRARGLRTVNLASNHFRSQEVLLYLRIFLANGNTVDRILMQVDHNNLTPLREESSSAKYEIVPYLEDSVVQAHLRGRSPEWTVMRYLPMWRYVKCNFLWGPEEFIATATGYRKPLFDSTGTYHSHSRFKGPEAFHMKRTGHHLDQDMQGIIVLCKEKGIKLECFTSPYLSVVGTPHALDAPRQVVESAGLRLHDFSNRLSGKQNFNDIKHVSLLGGQHLTRMLIDEVICPVDTTVR